MWEIWGDLGRSGEIWGDLGRCGLLEHARRLGLPRRRLAHQPPHRLDLGDGERDLVRLRIKISQDLPLSPRISPYLGSCPPAHQ